MVEPRDQADQRRLARAGEADERHHLARFRLERDVVQDVGAVRIAEPDGFEPDVAVHGACGDGVARIDGLGDQREHRAHPSGAGNRALQLTGGVRDRRQRSVNRREIADDHGELADLQAAAHHVGPTDDDDERRSEYRDRADDDREQRRLPGDLDPRVHRRLAGGGVAAELVRLAREALDQADGAERLVQPFEELRLELLDPLFAADQRRSVVAQAEIQEGDDRQRQQRNRDVHPQQNGEHDRQRRHRGGQRKDAAHHQVLDRVGVDVDAVDAVGGARRDVVVQAQGGQMLEQAPPQVVDHPLPGIDLHLRAVGRHELIRRLQHHAGDDDGDEQHEAVAALQHRQPLRQRRGKRVVLQDVVDDDFKRPRLQRAEPDLGQQQHREQRHPRPVRAQKRQRPQQQRLLEHRSLGGGGRCRRRHPPTFRSGDSVRGDSRLGAGAFRGITTGTIASLSESAT